MKRDSLQGERHLGDWSATLTSLPISIQFPISNNTILTCLPILLKGKSLFHLTILLGVEVVCSSVLI